MNGGLNQLRLNKEDGAHYVQQAEAKDWCDLRVSIFLTESLLRLNQIGWLIAEVAKWN